MNFFRFVFALLLALGISGCATTLPKIDRIAEAKKLIAVQDWAGAYKMLEPALATNDFDVVAQGVQLVANNPPIMKLADEFFEYQKLKAYMVSIGPQNGRDFANIKLESYRRIATVANTAQARLNIDKAFLSFEEESRAAIIRRELMLKEAAARARITCADTLECSKMFSLTQIYIDQKATMKVQAANDTIIETYNPTDSMGIGMKALKYPSRGTSGEIVLSANCKIDEKQGDKALEASLDLCTVRKATIYDGFVPFVRANLVN